MVELANVLGTECFERVRAWIACIPFEQWPQQHRVRADQLRPAMVNDRAWWRFGEETDALVRELMLDLGARLPTNGKHGDSNRMLSVVMPGDGIHPHRDEQPREWVTRVHVPLATNPAAMTTIDGHDVHMELGHAYLLDTRREHSIRNEGPTPRVHFMFDVMRLH